MRLSEETRQKTALDVFRYFEEGMALPMAIGIADVLTNIDNRQCMPDNAVHRAAWALSTLLRVIEKEQDAESDQRRETIDAARHEKEAMREQVKVYFDPATDEAERAQLEEFITDAHIEAELKQLRHQEKSWQHMVDQDRKRMEILNGLKAKRHETA